MIFIKAKRWLALFLPLCALETTIYAAKPKNYLDSAKENIEQFFSSRTTDLNQVSLEELSRFLWREQAAPDSLAAIKSSGVQPQFNGMTKNNINPELELTLFDAIHQALQRRPEIRQSIATIAGQGANIDAAKAQYFPQISGGMSTADLTTGERGRQLYSLSATQVVYDFGKIKSDINIEKAKLLQEQANTLDSIDDIAYQTANAMININRYQEIVHIANQQIKGIARIAEIANLRANAGISSQADPIQAKSNLEAAQSNLLIQETQLKQYQQKLKMLLGYDVSNMKMHIPETIIRNSGLYKDPDFTQIPKMIAAQASVQVAKLQKEQTKLTAYPTINIKGSLNQAVNGKNPNNNEDDGFYSSVMLEANSNFFQGGANRSKIRSANYAEEAAKAAVNTVYLDVLDQIELIRVQVENKQKQMDVLALSKETTARTKELYQEQYKLGSRTVVDLLNSEQAIHIAAQEIENARYDIYSGLIQYIYVTGGSRELYQLNNTSIQGLEIQP